MLLTRSKKEARSGPGMATRGCGCGHLKDDKVLAGQRPLTSAALPAEDSLTWDVVTRDPDRVAIGEEGDALGDASS